MRGQDVKELVRLIDRENLVELKRENIFQPPMRIYSTLKIMYHNYKKSHELEIIQARIFNVPQQKSANQNFKPTTASASSLFQYHVLAESDLLLLIEMKGQLKQEARKQLYSQILKGIELQQSVGECLQCYRTLLNNEFMNKNMECYRMIEGKMINKLLTLSDIKAQEMRVIARNILGLPKIDEPILTLISHLYERVSNVRDFKELIMIFRHNFPNEPTKIHYQALFRICLPENLVEIKELLENRPAGLRDTLFQVAQAEAKHKLANMEYHKTSKTRDILNFVVFCVQQGMQIWAEIIEWEYKAAQEPKFIFKDKLEATLVNMLQDHRFFQTVVVIAEKMSDIDEHSEIGLVFVRELLMTESKEYLRHRTIRRFLAIKILKYNNCQDYVKLLFNKSLIFAELVIQLFNFKLNSLSFYLHILSNDTEKRMLQDFLTELELKLPQKFKMFYVRAILADGDRGEMLTLQSAMMGILAARVSIEMATSIIQDLALYQMPRPLIAILTKIILKFRSHENVAHLRAATIRSLNLMLLRNDKADIPASFQIQFPAFLKEHFLTETNLIFANVSQDTTDELKKTYDFYLKRMH